VALSSHRTSGETARGLLLTVAASLLIILSSLNGAFAASALAQETIWQAPQPPSVTAEAVYSVDITRGLELYSKNADERLPMGSTAKIATALAVVEYLDPDTEITIAEGDPVSDPTMYSNMGLQPGMVFTVEELLYGLLIPSGNDAATALARVIGTELTGGTGDPIAAFMDALNQLVVSLGATNSHFSTPHGLEGDGPHYTTARDLAILTTRLLQNPLLAEIVGTSQVTLTSRGEDATELSLATTNKLLGVDDSVIGVKTGSTEPAGGCLVIATKQGENTVVTVILGSDLEYGGETGYLVDARWDDVDAVLRGINQNYRWVDLGDSGLLDGLNAELAAWEVELNSTGSIVVPVSQGDLRYRLELGPPGEPEAEVGHVLFFAGSTVVAELPVYQRSST
jgi:D-alanyl-D-alanine carboxypeptidase (penicillin-binding protein 5/6)